MIDLPKIYVELRRVSIDLLKVSIDLRKVSIELRKVSLEPRKVSLEPRKGSLAARPPRLIMSPVARPPRRMAGMMQTDCTSASQPLLATMSPVYRPPRHSTSPFVKSLNCLSSWGARHAYDRAISAAYACPGGPTRQLVVWPFTLTCAIGAAGVKPSLGPTR